jgi:hypothetical protein
MTWAYKDRPIMTSQLATAYYSAAMSEGAQVVPVGVAFAKALQGRPTLQLYAPNDHKHPSISGTYLAAAVFFSSFYNTTTEGIAPPKGLLAKDAIFLQRVAWETVRSLQKR